MSESSTDYIVIECAEETAQEISEQFSNVPGLDYRANSQEYLDGDSATWIVVATLTIQALPHITNLISRLKDKSSVTIEFDGTKYVGPLSKENQAKIEKAILAQFEKKSGK